MSNIHAGISDIDPILLKMIDFFLLGCGTENRHNSYFFASGTGGDIESIAILICVSIFEPKGTGGIDITVSVRTPLLSWVRLFAPQRRPIPAASSASRVRTLQITTSVTAGLPMFTAPKVQQPFFSLTCFRVGGYRLPTSALHAIEPRVFQMPDTVTRST